MPWRPVYLHDLCPGDVVRVNQGGPLTIERVERLSSVQMTVIDHRGQAWPLQASDHVTRQVSQDES